MTDKSFKQALKYVSFPVFNNGVHVVRTENIEKSIAHFKQTRDQLPKGYSFRDTAGFTLVTNESDIWVFLPFKAKPDTDAHEAFHAVRHMLMYAGVELDNELFAYHLGYLVREMQPDGSLYKIKRKMHKRKK